jgi:hypothetical protein
MYPLTQRDIVDLCNTLDDEDDDDDEGGNGNGNGNNNSNNNNNSNTNSSGSSSSSPNAPHHQGTPPRRRASASKNNINNSNNSNSNSPNASEKSPYSSSSNLTLQAPLLQRSPSGTLGGSSNNLSDYGFTHVRKNNTSMIEMLWGGNSGNGSGNGNGYGGITPRSPTTSNNINNINNNGSSGSSGNSVNGSIDNNSVASTSTVTAQATSAPLMHMLIDFTPADFITLLFTDLGVLTPAAVSDELIKLYQ